MDNDLELPYTTTNDLDDIKPILKDTLGDESTIDFINNPVSNECVEMLNVSSNINEYVLSINVRIYPRDMFDAGINVNIPNTMSLLSVFCDCLAHIDSRFEEINNPRINRLVNRGVSVILSGLSDLMSADNIGIYHLDNSVQLPSSIQSILVIASGKIAVAVDITLDQINTTS